MSNTPMISVSDMFTVANLLEVVNASVLVFILPENAFAFFFNKNSEGSLLVNEATVISVGS